MTSLEEKLLRESDRVTATIRTFWDLMVRTSEQFGGQLNAVNREGYRELHLRVSKALSATFDIGAAETLANRVRLLTSQGMALQLQGMTLPHF